MAIWRVTTVDHSLFTSKNIIMDQKFIVVTMVTMIITMIITMITTTIIAMIIITTTSKGEKLQGSASTAPHSSEWPVMCPRPHLSAYHLLH